MLKQKGDTGTVVSYTSAGVLYGYTGPDGRPCLVDSDEARHYHNNVMFNIRHGDVYYTCMSAHIGSGHRSCKLGNTSRSIHIQIWSSTCVSNRTARSPRCHQRSSTRRGQASSRCRPQSLWRWNTPRNEWQFLVSQLLETVLTLREF